MRCYNEIATNGERIWAEIATLGSYLSKQQIIPDLDQCKTSAKRYKEIVTELLQVNLRTDFVMGCSNDFGQEARLDRANGPQVKLVITHCFASIPECDSDVRFARDFGCFATGLCHQF